MSNTKISALPAITTPGDTDVVPIVQSGNTSKVTWANIKATLVSTAMSWTGLQIFDSTKAAIKGSSTGSTAIASANASANDYIATIPAKTFTFAGVDDISKVTINAQTGTTYTFVLGDGINTLVSFANASTIAVTIPTNDSVAFPIGTKIDCIQDGAGKVTFSGAGVTINSQASNKAIAAQYVGVSLVKEATDTWYLIGNLIA